MPTVSQIIRDVQGRKRPLQAQKRPQAIRSRVQQARGKAQSSSRSPTKRVAVAKELTAVVDLTSSDEEKDETPTPTVRRVRDRKRKTPPSTGPVAGPSKKRVRSGTQELPIVLSD